MSENQNNDEYQMLDVEVKFSNISPSDENKQPNLDSYLPVIFLDGGVLFPQNVVINQGLSGIRLEDVGSQQLEGLNVCVITRSNEGVFKNYVDMDGDQRSFSTYATVANVSGVTKLANGQYGLILKGSHPVFIKDFVQNKGRPLAQCEKVNISKPVSSPDNKAAFKLLKTMALELFKNSPIGSQESFTLISSTDDPVILCHLICAHLTVDLVEKVDLLSVDVAEKLMEKVTTLLVKENEFSEIILGIQDKVKGEVNLNMKRAFLREQLEAMKKELGELDGSKGEVYDLQGRLEESSLPSKSKEEISKELTRMEMMSPGSPEYMVSYNYVNWVLDLPWERETIEAHSISEASDILNNDHYGLLKVKERIVEHVASLKHVSKQKGQILLLLGPPGVGKTSLAKSIAKTLNRPYERISLGGVDDVSEIRGHRRTYIGAMPGRIIDALKRAGSSSPLILLDEIDKAGKSHKGDLGAALLEVLDPEQNKNFQDHYISVPFDLSDVVFLATANSLEGISAPLLDRMEVISLSGYDENEKLSIAKKYLIPTLKREFDLRRSDLNISQSVLKLIIRHYTRESGVRMLKQKLSSLARKAVCNLVDDKDALKITTDNLSQLLGKPIVKADEKISKLVPGVSLGLAYTPYGGDVLHVEAVSHESTKGSIKLTGQLGDVMKESASAAISYVMSKAHDLDLDVEMIEKQNIHVHFPEGAVPKDGPSAGTALLCCLVSLLKNKSLPKNLAMTGEITLRGDVLAVGGIREKVMGAHRAGVDKVIIPASNWFDLDDVPSSVLTKMKFYPVAKMSDVLKIAGLIHDEGDKIYPRQFSKTEDKVKIPLKKWQPQKINEILDQM